MSTQAQKSSLSYLPATAGEVLDQSVGDALRLAARTWPDKIALVVGASDSRARQRWTFDGLLRESERAARALLSRFSPGDHVAMWAANGSEWVFVEFGAALAGLILISVNPAYTTAELTFVLRQSRAKGILFQDEYRGKDLAAMVREAQAAIPDLSEVIPLSTWRSFTMSARQDIELPIVQTNDVAQIQYTSGTTGAPKGARLSHRSLSNNARIYAQVIGAGPDDRWVNPMPMFHTAGCGLATLGALQTGGTHILPPAFDPALMLQLLKEERGSIVLCVPTMLIRILDQPDISERDLSSWRLVTLGGAPVSPDLVRRAEAHGLTVAIGFGQTEASPYITHTLPNDPHPDWISTVGRPMPQMEVKIIDPNNGSTVPLGVVGEICARGYSVMLDYFDNPEGTRAVIDAEGWLHTGDLGLIDHHGYCRIQGRNKDMIIRGGENIYPREIEDILFEHSSVADVAVVGVPDREWGEVPVGFVQLKPGQEPSAEELENHCRRRLASYKVPRIWRFIEQYPLTASGKVQKFALREQYVSEGSKIAG